MVRLLKYFAVLFFCAFAVSYALFSFLNYGLRHQKNDSFGVINELITSNADHRIVFVGSSLSKNNINPLVFDSITGTNSYNFGFYGAKINHSEMIIKRYLSSHHPVPETIFLMLEPYILDSLNKINFPVQYYPYYNDSLIYEYVSKCDEDIKTIASFPFIGITKYNDYLKSLGIAGTLFPNRIAKGLIKGFEPLHGSHMAEIEKASFDKALKSEKINDEGLRCFESICRLCQQKKIKLVIVIPPTFLSERIRKKYDVKEFISVLNPFIVKYNMLLLDHTSLDLCYKKELFFDGHHLNDKGANVYSRILASAVFK